MSFVAGACAYWGVPPYRGILGGDVRYYDDVAVSGLGRLGLCAVQLLRACARRVLALDIVAMRREVAVNLGPDPTLEPRDPDLLPTVREPMPRDPRVVLELAGT